MTAEPTLGGDELKSTLSVLRTVIQPSGGELTINLPYFGPYNACLMSTEVTNNDTGGPGDDIFGMARLLLSSYLISTLRPLFALS